MPLYEYYCNDCQTKFERLRPMSQADDPIQCKSCESMHTSRALSLFAAHVKHVKGGASSPAALSGGGCSGKSCSSCSTGCSCGRH